MLSRCILCETADAAVTEVATCSNRCTILGHPECFTRRRTFPLWRKKHYHRPNSTESEVCLVSGCQGKHRAVKLVTHDSDERLPMAATCVPVTPAIDDPSRPCCFMGRDGLPCRRVAITDNACTRHGKDALFMKKMIDTQYATDVVTQSTDDAPVATANMSTQTLSRSDVSLRRMIQDLEHTVQEKALAVTRMEIHMESVMAECETLHVVASEDETTIARLEAEIREVRTENVALKRREECLKGSFLTAANRERRETISKVQEYLATL